MRAELKDIQRDLIACKFGGQISIGQIKCLSDQVAYKLLSHSLANQVGAAAARDQGKGDVDAESDTEAQNQVVQFFKDELLGQSTDEHKDPRMQWAEQFFERLRLEIPNQKSIILIQEIPDDVCGEIRFIN